MEKCNSLQDNSDVTIKGLIKARNKRNAVIVCVGTSRTEGAGNGPEKGKAGKFAKGETANGPKACSEAKGVKMIKINNLTKIYKLGKKKMAELKTNNPEKIAVNGLSLETKEGEIFGLLGPNGAGKTTTLRCVATLLKPTDGEVSVCGFDSVKQGEEVRENICFLTNEIKLDPNFTADYMFKFFGRLHGMSEEAIEKRQHELFSEFGINDFKDKKIEELSTGMKQKAAIAVSLVHDPKVVIFDEPTSGLDIITARVVTDYLKKLKEAGKTVIISTHIMSEAEKLCDRIAVVINGQKACEGTLSEILEKTGADDLEEAFFRLYKQYNPEN